MAPSWQGHAQITYTLRGDKTVPQVKTQAPVRVQQPFYPEGDRRCHTILLHTAGGMVGGDRLAYDLTLEPHTQALVTTAAAAKIYNDEPHQRPATVTGHITLGTGAWLEWLPQETILFEGGRYHQRWQVTLEDPAQWLGWEVLRLGRTARGERFVQGALQSHWDVWQGGHLVWTDPQGWEAQRSLWESPHGLGECPVLGTLTWVGTDVEPPLVQDIRELAPGAIGGSGTWGVSRLQSGLVCRYRGHSTTAVRRWFEAVRRRVRTAGGQGAAIAPRVWQR